MNLIVAPGTDLFATAAAPGGLVPRPPGEGWSLAGLEVSHDFVRGGEGQLRVVYFWTRSKVYGEAERLLEATAPKVGAGLTEGGGLIAAAEVLAKGGSLSKAAKAAAGDAQKGKS